MPRLKHSPLTTAPPPPPPPLASCTPHPFTHAFPPGLPGTPPNAPPPFQASVLRMLEGSPQTYLHDPILAYLEERNVKINLRTPIRDLPHEVGTPRREHCPAPK